MLMISTKTIQPPTNGLLVIVLVHASIVAKIIVSIIVRNPMTKPALHRKRLSFTRKGIVNQVMVAAMEDILVVATIIKADYERNKLGVAITSPVATGGNCFDGVWMDCYCKYNTKSGAPHVHTTNFHDAAHLAGTSYCLPSTHPSHHHDFTDSNSIRT